MSGIFCASLLATLLMWLRCVLENNRSIARKDQTLDISLKIAYITEINRAKRTFQKDGEKWTRPPSSQLLQRRESIDGDILAFRPMNFITSLAHVPLEAMQFGFVVRGLRQPQRRT
jgi:hypothetical protein